MNKFSTTRKYTDMDKALIEAEHLAGNISINSFLIHLTQEMVPDDRLTPGIPTMVNKYQVIFVQFVED